MQTEKQATQPHQQSVIASTMAQALVSVTMSRLGASYDELSEDRRARGDWDLLPLVSKARKLVSSSSASLSTKPRCSHPDCTNVVVSRGRCTRHGVRFCLLFGSPCLCSYLVHGERDYRAAKTVRFLDARPEPSPTTDARAMVRERIIAERLFLFFVC